MMTTDPLDVDEAALEAILYDLSIDQLLEILEVMDQGDEDDRWGLTAAGARVVGTHEVDAVAFADELVTWTPYRHMAGGYWRRSA